MPRVTLVAFAFALATVAAIAAAPSHAATAFMYVQGVAGTSPTDKDHGGWIELTKFTAPVQSDQPATLGGLGPVLGDIEIGKLSDTTSTALMNAASNGTVFPVIKIDYCLICQKNVPPTPTDIFFIGEWTAEVAAFAGFDFVAPIENLTLTFGSLKYTYSKQDKDGNKTDGSFSADWTDPSLPPFTSTEGSPTGPFMLLNEFLIPEPTTAMVLGAGWLVVGMRRRGA